jgi:hypothetical protein
MGKSYLPSSWRSSPEREKNMKRSKHRNDRVGDQEITESTHSSTSETDVPTVEPVEHDRVGDQEINVEHDAPPNPLPPNQTYDWPLITPGICRHMEPFMSIPASPPATGGGDLNGTAALILHGHSGTGLASFNMPSLPRNVGGV